YREFRSLLRFTFHRVGIHPRHFKLRAPIPTWFVFRKASDGIARQMLELSRWAGCVQRRVFISRSKQHRSADCRCIKQELSTNIPPTASTSTKKSGRG